MEEFRDGALAYTHFGARSARLDRFDSYAISQFFALCRTLSLLLKPRCSEGLREIFTCEH